jgi:rhodanese-related sulfurtransferase
VIRFSAAATAAALLFAQPAAAEVSLRDTAALQAFLAGGAPCCVIDARNAAKRLSAPLAETLPYRKDLKIDPAGVVVVIADTDAQAVEIGKALERSSKAKVVYAVKGGERAWRAATGSIADGASGGFIIPRNTCESGTAIQQY